MRVLLDTHVWLWWLTGSANLPVALRGALDAAAERGQLAIAAISLWEAQMLHTKNRLELPVEFPEWLRRAAAPEVITVMPLDVQAVTALDRLPGRFHGDPADRLIAATALAHGLPLLTFDDRIRRSRVVRLWKPPTRKRAT